MGQQHLGSDTDEQFDILWKLLGAEVRTIIYYVLSWTASYMIDANTKMAHQVCAESYQSWVWFWNDDYDFGSHYDYNYETVIRFELCKKRRRKPITHLAF